MTQLLDLTGDTYGRLKVLRRAGSDKRNESLWACQCQCGGLVNASSSLLRYWKVTSCGCQRVESARDLMAVHGWTGPPEHKAWIAMKRRCYSPNHTQFPTHGGRGIEVCDEWKEDFLAFLGAVGEKPSAAHRLMRDDIEDHFRPGNVSWRTPKGKITRRQS